MLSHHYYLISHVLLSLSHSDKFCQSLKRNLPKLAGKLKSLTLWYTVRQTCKLRARHAEKPSVQCTWHDSNHVQINYHLCVDGIVHLLNSSLNHLNLNSYKTSSTDFDNLTTAIAISKLKHFEMSNWPVSSVRGESLAKLLKQSKTLEQVTVSTEQHDECYQWQCNVIRLLIKAMTRSNVKKLELRIKCNCDFSDIPYDRDKVKI